MQSIRVLTNAAGSVDARYAIALALEPPTGVAAHRHFRADATRSHRPDP